VELLLSFAGTAMASMHAAPIRLNGRTFEHVRGSPAVILGSLAHFYQKEIIAEAYKLVGALEFLGNPVSARTNSSGSENSLSCGAAPSLCSWSLTFRALFSPFLLCRCVSVVFFFRSAW
jgi:hypothetical protein